MSILFTILNEQFPGRDFANSHDWVGDGIIDSFDVIILVNFIEKRTNLKIDGARITQENFRNVETIVALLTELGVENA